MWRWSALAVVSVAFGAGCGASSTGVHVHAHMAGQPYDELRFGVVLVPPLGSAEPARTIVDPATRGRYPGPFNADGDQDVVILLNDDVAEQMVNCAVAALAGGQVTASGASEVLIQSQAIVDV